VCFGIPCSELEVWPARSPVFFAGLGTKCSARQTFSAEGVGSRRLRAGKEYRPSDL
jgi:hypothetical protein